MCFYGEPRSSRYTYREEVIPTREYRHEHRHHDSHRHHDGHRHHEYRHHEHHSSHHHGHHNHHHHHGGSPRSSYISISSRNHSPRASVPVVYERGGGRTVYV